MKILKNKKIVIVLSLFIISSLILTYINSSYFLNEILNNSELAWKYNQLVYGTNRNLKSYFYKVINGKRIIDETDCFIVPRVNLPKGIIVAWRGSYNTIPSGWVLCDGNNGQTINGVRIPDLRSRFVIMPGKSYPIYSTGGEELHKLTLSEMASHNHGIPMTGIPFGSFYCFFVPLFCMFTFCYPCLVTLWFGPFEKTKPSGGDEPHNNMPPFIGLCYIVRVSDR